MSNTKGKNSNENKTKSVKVRSGLWDPSQVIVRDKIDLGESFVITCEDDGLYDEFKEKCIEAGYHVYLFDMSNPKESASWDTFADIVKANENNVYSLIDTLASDIIRETGHKNRADYWNAYEKQLLKACIAMICLDEQYEGKRTFEELINLVVSSGEQIREKFSNANEQVKNFAKGISSIDDGKLKENFRVGLISRLSELMAPEMSKTLSGDDICMEEIGIEKTAIFVCGSETNACKAITSFFMKSVLWNLIQNAEKREDLFYIIMDEYHTGEVMSFCRVTAPGREIHVRYCSLTK